MELSRRRFMAFLTAAPFVFDPNRKIFDMGRSKIWTPPPPEIYTGEYASIELGPHIEASINAVLGHYGEASIELGPHIEASINAVLGHYGEAIIDHVFTPSPVFTRLINGNGEQEFLRKIDR